VGTLPRPRLLVTLEQALAIMCGNAGAGVGDGEYQARRPVVPAYRHLPMLGELHCIADQVQQDLPYARLIAYPAA